MNVVYTILLLGALLCAGLFWYIVVEPTFTILGLPRFGAMILLSLGGLICTLPVILSSLKK